MKHILSFLTYHISSSRVEDKTIPVNDAFEREGCLEDVPRVPGIYIMVAKTAKFVYPKGKSPVFYIGHLIIYTRG